MLRRSRLTRRNPASTYACTPLSLHMSDPNGQDTVERLGNKDLNRDGAIINLAVVGSSRFYDFRIFESAIEAWVDENGYPDLLIVGGASGVDYMAERWADNSRIPLAVFSEEWGDSKRTLKDRGRPEAPNSLTHKILGACTHVLALPSPTSKWTRVVMELAQGDNVPLHVHELE